MLEIRCKIELRFLLCLFYTFVKGKLPRKELKGKDNGSIGTKIATNLNEL